VKKKRKRRRRNGGRKRGRGELEEAAEGPPSLPLHP